MPPQTPKTSLVAMLTAPLTAVPVTIGLTLLALGWVAPAGMQRLCIFFGIMTLVVTLGLAFSIWLFRQPSPPPPPQPPGPPPPPARVDIGRLRAQFVKSLASNAPYGREVRRRSAGRAAGAHTSAPLRVCRG